MEHRLHPRKPVNFDVVIQYRGLGMISGSTRDVSMEGMFVELGRVLIPKNAMVKLSIPVATNRGERAHTTEAMVIHQSESGVGLMLCDVDDEMSDVLHQILKQGTPGVSSSRSNSERDEDASSDSTNTGG